MPQSEQEITISEKKLSYQPFREDLPLGLFTWLFFLFSNFGFVAISVYLGGGLMWGVFTSFVISLYCQFVWHSTTGALIFKRLLTTVLFRFLMHAWRKKSFSLAAKERLEPDAEEAFTTIIQKHSRLLVIIPLLLLLATWILDWMLAANLRYFIIACGYHTLVGFVWMSLCRKGSLAILPIDWSDSSDSTSGV